LKLKAQNSDQKLRGGYYTPEDLAEFIIQWALQNEQSMNAFEPSCGDGVFLEALVRHPHFSKLKCVAVELDNVEANKAKDKMRLYSNVEVLNKDFFSVYEQYKNDMNSEGKGFDVIVGNPPYIRYQYLSPEQRVAQADILVSNGMKSNKLINAWVSFVVACVELLNDNGRIGMVIPAELLQVAYAEDLRLFLINNLSSITVITFEELVFPDVQQEVVLLLAEKNKEDSSRSKSSIRLIELENLECLAERITEMQPIEYQQAMKDKNKWTRYFLNTNETNLIYQVQSNHRFVSFSDIADVDIGITTGNNGYFSVNKTLVDKYELHNVTRPLIGRSSHASGLYFNDEDWRQNVNRGVDAFLIDFPDIPYGHYPSLHKSYIELGEQEGVNKGYKCSIRDRWYRVPSIWAPDAFFLRRNNKFPKFVLNDINAVSTDTMHRIKFNEGLDRDKILLSYYNSITFAFTEIEGRSYGGGVLEILPGELEKIMMPNLQDMDASIVKDLLCKIDKAIRGNIDIEPVLDEVDKKVLIEYIGIDKKVVTTFRIIWKKLMYRRLNRKRKSSQKLIV